VSNSPSLLRRRGRRGFFRRSVFLGALVGVLLVLAPTASGAPPEITVTVTGTLGSNGWYRGNVVVNWDVQGETYSEGCNTVPINADTPGTKITCYARNDADQTETTKSVTIKLDKTAPAVSTVLERQADANGWYNRPLTVAFSGTDATSGISTCTSMRYAGPDNPSALASGSCSDIAGNSTPVSFAFKYDATAPSVFSVTATHGNRSAQLSWRKSSDTKVIEVFRAPGRNGQGESGIYRGTANGIKDTGLVVGRKYEYRVIGVDEAANRVEQRLSLVATGALLSPTPGLKITMKSPPALAWAPAKGATYYNIQLIYKGRKVLSAWPQRPSFRLRRTWLYRGRRYRLQPGVYRWYVWPGYGRISAARYAKRPLGSSSFVVTK
jgi:hypothetical protein